MINMKNEKLFAGKTAAVCGIGISNIPLIDFLVSHGAIVTARDKKNRDEISVAEHLESIGVRLILGNDYLSDLTEDYIFRSPGIRFDIPEFCAAVERGAVLTSEMELFFQLCPAKIIGITGSDGKTTTTTIISKMLMQEGKRVYLGGNIGTPLLPLVEEMSEDEYAVVELSSFQLHTMKHSPDIAVITNLSPNHLDYHRDMKEYINAKCNIYRHMKPGGKIVLNYNNEVTRNLSNDVSDGIETLFFGSKKGIYISDTEMIVSSDHGSTERSVMPLSDILLPGKHNAENYMAAIAALDGIVQYENMAYVARNFKGVEHRIELCGEANGVKYINSSIDSSPTRTIAAINALQQYHKKTVIICGGYDKNIPFEPLARPICQAAKAVILTGATAEKIKKVLYDYIATSKTDNKEIPLIIHESDFTKAVYTASATAQPGDIVLLSPACASFDAFPNFEKRGEHFKKTVKEIILKNNGEL